MESLKELLKKPWFKIALGGVIVLGAYVFFRNKSAAAQQTGAAPASEGGGVANVNQSIQGLQQQNAVLGQALGSIGYQLEQDILALQAVVNGSANPKPNDMFFYTLGRNNTTLGCYNPVTGDVDITCFNQRRNQDPGTPPGYTTDGNAAATYIKSVWGQWIANQKIDFLGAGKYEYSQGAGLGNIGQNTGQGTGGGGVNR